LDLYNRKALIEPKHKKLTIDRIYTDNPDYGYRFMGTSNNGIQISMNGKGRSIDNIMIERFF
jgi:transposase InsO family protein